MNQKKYNVIRFEVIQSSADFGNCIIVETTKALILLDLGVSPLSVSKVMERSNFFNRGILNPNAQGKKHFDFVFITHHHSDHNKGLNQFINQEEISWDYLFMPEWNGEGVICDNVKDSFNILKSTQEIENILQNTINLDVLKKREIIKNFEFRISERYKFKRYIFNPSNLNVLNKTLKSLNFNFFQTFQTDPLGRKHLKICFAYFIDGLLYLTDTSLTSALFAWVSKLNIELGMVESNHSINEFYEAPLMSKEGNLVNWSQFRAIDTFGHLSNENFFKIKKYHEIKNFKEKRLPPQFIGTHPSLNHNFKIWEQIPQSEKQKHNFYLASAGLFGIRNKERIEEWILNYFH